MWNRSGNRSSYLTVSTRYSLVVLTRCLTERCRGGGMSTTGKNMLDIDYNMQYMLCYRR